MGFIVALQFLTAIPALIRREPQPRELGQAMAYYPLVGLLLGLALAGLGVGLSLVFPAPLTAALLVGAWVIFTGGLHLDGLMDVCDGVFSQPNAARRLAVMRDTRAGSYGVLGASCVLLAKFAALFSVIASSWSVNGQPYASPALAGLVMAPTLGRWAMVLATAGFPSARPDGLGQIVKASVGWPQVGAATAITLAVGLAVGPMGVALVLLAAIVAWLAGRYFQANLGGLTGDTYGAINEVTEVIVLLVVAATIIPEAWWRGW